MEQGLTSTVSVLTPVYNAVHHVARYRADIARQARQPDRIVLYDDGSTDGTGDLLAEWAARDSRVRLIDGGTSRGRGAARQALLEAVETDYVAWLDVDDFWHPQKLHVQVEEFEALERGGGVGTAFESAVSGQQPQWWIFVYRPVADVWTG